MGRLSIQSIISFCSTAFKSNKLETSASSFLCSSLSLSNGSKSPIMDWGNSFDIFSTAALLHDVTSILKSFTSSFFRLYHLLVKDEYAYSSLEPFLNL